LVGVCQAKAAGKETEIPLRVTMKEVPVEPITVFVVRAGVFYLLRQRPENAASILLCYRKKKQKRTKKRTKNFTVAFSFVFC
jgi:hypothetical protein